MKIFGVLAASFFAPAIRCGKENRQEIDAQAILFKTFSYTLLTGLAGVRAAKWALSDPDWPDPQKTDSVIEQYGPPFLLGAALYHCAIEVLRAQAARKEAAIQEYTRSTRL